MRKHYINYIFDLYGTLVDIHTDEMNLNMWKKLAGLYEVYGVEYQPEQLRAAFLRMDLEERDLIRARLRCEYPENQLEVVFLRLLKESRVTPKSYKLDIQKPTINPEVENMDAKQNDILRLPENENVWVEFMANTFRVLSRDYIRLYPETLSTLKRLKDMDCRIYLLSNAQAVFTRPEIHALGLEPYFDKMYLSSDYGVMKPEPSYMQRLLEEEGLSAADTVMVGNEIRSDVKIADSCGVDAILINTSGNSKAELKRQAEEVGIRHSFLSVSSIGKII